MFLNFEWPAMGIVFDSLKPEPRLLADARQAVTPETQGEEAQWNRNHLGVLIPEAVARSPLMNTTDIYEAEGRADDDLHEADIVEWYEARPVTVPAAVAAGSIIAAFTLGALTAVGVLFLTGQLDD